MMVSEIQPFSGFGVSISSAPRASRSSSAMKASSAVAFALRVEAAVAESKEAPKGDVI